MKRVLVIGGRQDADKVLSSQVCNYIRKEGIEAVAEADIFSSFPSHEVSYLMSLALRKCSHLVVLCTRDFSRCNAVHDIVFTFVAMRRPAFLVEFDDERVKWEEGKGLAFSFSFLVSMCQSITFPSVTSLSSEDIAALVSCLLPLEEDVVAKEGKKTFDTREALYKARKDGDEERFRKSLQNIFSFFCNMKEGDDELEQQKKEILIAGSSRKKEEEELYGALKAYRDDDSARGTGESSATDDMKLASMLLQQSVKLRAVFEDRKAKELEREAVKIMMKLSDKGVADPLTLFNLSLCYYHGKGTEKDIGKSRECAVKAGKGVSFNHIIFFSYSLERYLLSTVLFPGVC
uniref:Uncharacterized protein n=1 Tax=Palpitomonas bilix TaxID=652834 RepID=A0A7S3G7P1_9EUKA